MNIEIEELNLESPLPAIRPAVVRGARKTIVRDDGVISELYPYSYKPEGLIGNLKFVMRYEPIDLGVLYTKETKSSFAMEGETVSASRTERFVAALHRAAEFDTSDKQSFIKLQNSIVDSRYAEDDWRGVQNYVSETMSDFREQVHFICPKPEDVEDLMNGWMKMVARLDSSEIDSVCAAAATAFGFVFIHPFEDCNGRIHRILVHHTLARKGFTPEGVLFPISAVMLRDSKGYNNALSSFSSSVRPLIEYSLNSDGRLTVHNETADLYRYWDATRFVEYLYKCVAETIRIDLKEELGFLAVFDAAMKAVMEIVDMPNRRASLLIRLILQNKGTLSKGKHSQFSELSDDEIKTIESAIQKCANVLT